MYEHITSWTLALLTYLRPEPLMLDVATLGTSLAAGMAWTLVIGLQIRTAVAQEGMRTAMGLTVTGELFLIASGFTGGLCGTAVSEWIMAHPAVAYLGLLGAYLRVRSQRAQGRDIFTLPALPMPAFLSKWMGERPNAAHPHAGPRPVAPRPLALQQRSRLGL
jgi:hypothetical protein